MAAADATVRSAQNAKGEEDGLGLQMAALIVASAGWRLLFLGTNVSAQQIAAVANERKAEAVGLGVSVAIGGEGAQGVRGADVVRDLAALDAWARNGVGHGTTRSVPA